MELQFHAGARGEPCTGFEKDAAGRRVDDERQASWPDACQLDSMTAARKARRAAALAVHRGVHVPLERFSSSVRTFPVAPYTRKTS